MKDRLIGFVTHNTGLKIMSLIFAAILWLVVVSVDDPITSRTFTQIPVELINTEVVTDAGQIFEVEDGTDIVSIRVSAKRSVLDSLKSSDFKATADMARADGSLVPVSVSALKYANRIEDITLRSRQNVKVVIEKLVEKKYHVQIDTKGAIADGYVIGEIRPEKEEVLISGPESVVNTISDAKIVVDMTGMAGDMNISEEVILADAKGNEIVSDDLTVSDATIAVEVVMWLTKEVPISFGYVGVPEEGFGLSGENYCTPGSITVAGIASELRQVENISIPASRVDISGATGDKDISVDIAQSIPDGITVYPKNASTEIIVHIGVSSLSIKTVEVPTTNITAINVPDGVHATIGGLGVVTAVNVRGIGNAFDNVDPNSISGYVDVSTIELPDEGAIPAAYSAKVNFVFPANLYDGGNEVQAQVILQYVDGAQNNDDVQDNGTQDDEDSEEDQDDSSEADEESDEEHNDSD